MNKIKQFALKITRDGNNYSWAVVFMGIALALVIRLVLRIFTGTDFIVFKLSENMASYKLLQFIGTRHILNLLLLSFNVAILLSFSNNANLKDVYKFTWIALLVIAIIDILAIPNVSTYAVVALMLLSNIAYNLCIKSRVKNHIITTLILIGLIILTGGYQLLVMYIWFDSIPAISQAMENMIELSLSLEMHMVLFVIYKFRIKGAS
jgi:hypothetical protein